MHEQWSKLGMVPKYWLHHFLLQIKSFHLRDGEGKEGWHNPELIRLDQTLKCTQPLCLHLESISQKKKKKKSCFQPPGLIARQTVKMLAQWYGPYKEADFWLLDQAEGELWKEASLIPVPSWIPVLFCSPPSQIRRFELYSSLKKNLLGLSSPAFLWILDVTSGGTSQIYSVHPSFGANSDASPALNMPVSIKPGWNISTTSLSPTHLPF